LKFEIPSLHFAGRWSFLTMDSALLRLPCPGSARCLLAFDHGFCCVRVALPGSARGPLLDGILLSRCTLVAHSMGAIEFHVFASLEALACV
jgi:hypothetical protein